MSDLKPCLIDKHVRYGNPKHGAYARNKRLYNVWATMLHRCEDPKREKFKDYGMRGIKVCDEWHDPNTFMDWAETSGYKDGLQLDRINNDGDYEPANCRWATPKENSRHTRRTKYLTLNGETKSVAEWCEVLPISQYTIYWWLREFGEKECEHRVCKRLSNLA